MPSSRDQIESQLRAHGPYGAPAKAFAPKGMVARLVWTCQSADCRSTMSVLTTLCSVCGDHTVPLLPTAPIADWRSIAVKMTRQDGIAEGSVRLSAAAVLMSTPTPTQAWVHAARIECGMRAIEHMRLIVRRSKKGEFETHGGDIIFLMRHPIYNGRHIVSVRDSAGRR